MKIGGRLRRLDFRFPASNVVIEADGYAWHCNPIAFERGRERSSAWPREAFECCIGPGLLWRSGRRRSSRSSDWRSEVGARLKQPVRFGFG